MTLLRLQLLADIALVIYPVLVNPIVIGPHFG